MANKNCKYDRFNSFLNKTIVLSSKRYYKDENSRELKELMIMDDENYTEYTIDSNGNKVYVMETPDSFLFVFPMKNSIIYGKGHGDYLSILGIE